MVKSKFSRWWILSGLLVLMASGIGLRYAVKLQQPAMMQETQLLGAPVKRDVAKKTAGLKEKAAAIAEEKTAKTEETAGRAMAPEPVMSPAAVAPVLADGMTDMIGKITGKLADDTTLPLIQNFQAAQGYWANTYLPDDPVLRSLQPPLTSVAVPLKPVWQPFDAPQSAALALYLQADQAFVGTADPTNGTRLFLQVGIKGSLRQRADRPALTVAVVLACRDWPQSAPLLQAVLMALVQAQQPGDRFALTVAQPSKNTPDSNPDDMVQPDQFRYGAIHLLMQRLPQTAPSGTDWLPALQQASSLGVSPEDSSSELGSRLMLLITDEVDLPASSALDHFAEQQAQQGIPLSVIRLGPSSAASASLPAWVLASQGHYYTLHQSQQAEAVITQELSAVSRVVARGLRVQIRLADSVKLVAILGSQRLDQPQVSQVQELERQIDQQVANALSIQQDRGADDAGIQIVIPAFYAGDEHVIVLDVVATQAGALLEASVRYKDLVMFRNGEAQAQLSLASARLDAGPLQHNVTKNALAWQLASTLRQASQHLKQNQRPAALRQIQRYQQHLTQQQQRVIGVHDSELRQDQQALAQYLHALQAVNTPAQYQELGAALQYASFTKVLSHPNKMKED